MSFLQEFTTFYLESIDISRYLIVMNSLVVGLLFFNASLLLLNRWLLKRKIIDNNVAMFGMTFQTVLYSVMIFIHLFNPSEFPGVLLWVITAFIVVTAFNLIYYSNVLKHIKRNMS